MNVHELLREWQNGRAVVTFDQARPDAVSRPSFYRMASAGQIPGVLTLGRKRLLSLPVYLEFLGVPHEVLWPAGDKHECTCREARE